MDDLDGLSLGELAGLRERLLLELDQTAVFTPGSFQEEWRRCGKKNCHCARDGDKGHGPFFSVERWEGGRSRKHRVPAGMVDQVRARVVAWERFQDVCGRIGDVNVEESRRLLLGGDRVGGGSGSAGQKGGSKA